MFLIRSLWAIVINKYIIITTYIFFWYLCYCNKQRYNCNWAPQQHFLATAPRAAHCLRRYAGRRGAHMSLRRYTGRRMYPKKIAAHAAAGRAVASRPACTYRNRRQRIHGSAPRIMMLNLTVASNSMSPKGKALPRQPRRAIVASLPHLPRRLSQAKGSLALILLGS
jgi:hypothetical protein